eukprot:GHVH01001217.1.p1 GENE.GHVH01001217.1~~GHVH01001217.1.p1  ORF type:complete len:630 (+),score=87.06 GHVH01001217.1:22-1890(+)
MSSTATDRNPQEVDHDDRWWYVQSIGCLTFMFAAYFLLLGYGRSMNDRQIIAIVGSGLAGLSAASDALHRTPGANIVLIDKSSTLGGNSSKATSGINGVGSRFHEDAGDSIDIFMNDVLASGKGLSDEDLVHILTAMSGPAIDDVDYSWGVALSDINILGGSSHARCHRAPKSSDGRSAAVGYTVTSAAKAHLQSEEFNARFTLLLNTSVTDIIFDDEGAVKSIHIEKQLDAVKKQKQSMKVAQVIIASGGFANSSDLLLEYAPKYSMYPTTNGWFATGDMLKLGLENGLSKVDIDQIQLHPTGFINPSDPLNSWNFLCPEVMRGMGGRLLNRSGMRFVNELATRDVVSQAIISQNNSIAKDYQDMFSNDGINVKCNAHAPSIACQYNLAVIVLSQSEVEKVGMSSILFYKFKGLLNEIDSKEALAATLDMPLDNVMGSLSTIEDGDMPIFYGFVTPSLHYTMGGLKVDVTSRALRVDGSPVPNLYVVGEAAGGVHGANRLGGNGCLESLVFGRWAATMATLKPGETIVVKVEKSKADGSIASVTYTGRGRKASSPRTVRLPTGELISGVELCEGPMYSSLYVDDASLCRFIADDSLPWGLLRPGSQLAIVQLDGKKNADEL